MMAKLIFLSTVKSLGQWHGYSSETGEHSVVKWGLETDKPVPADYNGDGKDDPANVYVQFDVVYRWKFTVDQNHETTITRWGNGQNNDQPVPDDYDGDGITDIAVYRNGQWWIKESSTQETRVFVFGRTFGYDYPAQFSALQSFY